jgi:hypothetical protein
MNLYAMLGSGRATNEAASLSKRLTVWHDAMVAHERKLRSGTAGEVCDDECPHAEARLLWSEAVDTFGSRAHELSFLRSRGGDTARRSTERATSRPSLVPSNGSGAAAEL